MRKLHLFNLLILFTLTAWAYDVKVDNVHFNLIPETNEAEVCGCSGWTAGISIPEEIEVKGKTYPVTSIRDSAFIGNGFLAGVDIPESIIRIGKAAFKDCGKLSSADIPASVRQIGDYAFRGCSSLANFVVSEDNNWYKSHEGVLYDKKMTVLIQCPRSKYGEFHAPESVKEIAPYAFYGCSKIGSVILYNPVERIGDHAFDNNPELLDVTMGTGMKYIGSKAFDRCKKLKHIYCQAAVPPTAQQDSFDLEWMEFCKLHVPSSSVGSYQKTKPWNWMDEVIPLTKREIEVGMQAPTIHTINKHNTSSFTLDGRKSTSGNHIVIIHDGSRHYRKVVKQH